MKYIISLGLGIFIGGIMYITLHKPHDYLTTIKEFTDGTKALDVLPIEAFTDRKILPYSAIDTSFDRRELLRILFIKVTSGAISDQDKIEAWITYLQNRIAHPLASPLLTDGTLVMDPYWILKNRIAQCGQTNRVLVDGLSTAGFKTRLVQLRNHVGAEVWLNGGWSYIDADWLDGGESVKRVDGSIPSAAEIHVNHSLLNSVHPGREFAASPVYIDTYGSFANMFDPVPYYYIKIATPVDERNVHFGWDKYEEIK